MACTLQMLEFKLFSQNQVSQKWKKKSKTKKKKQVLSMLEP